MGIAGLNAAISGLRASQQQISVISNNVANVGTEGYTRKLLPQSAQSIDGVTVGVLPGTITRNINVSLQRDLWTQISATDELDVKRGYLERIEKFHGDPSLEISLASEIAALRDSFSALTDTPDDDALLLQTVRQAEDTANKINSFAALINELRNDAQEELKAAVDRVNELLEIIADTNGEIKGSEDIGRSVAAIEDQRDNAIKELSGLMEITSFKRGDGVIVVQTNGGAQLADERAEALVLNPLAITPLTYYPDSARGVFVGDPITSPVTAVDLTQSSPGGKIGGLLELRDVTFPKQQAQLDELAHKMALRFEAQGLLLFTDNTGTLPADTPPDPTTNPPTPVAYVGFSGSIRVNAAVIADNTLIQQGTYNATNIETGSDEVIRRVLDFAFGDIEYQEAYNIDTATGVDLLNRGGDDLQTWLGLSSSNNLSASRDLSGFTNPADFITSTGGVIGAGQDTFRISFEDTRLGIGPFDIDISLTTLPNGAGSFTQDIVDEINAQVAGFGAAITPLGVVASVGTNGQIVINTSGSYAIDATGPAPANAMDQAGLTFLGLNETSGPVLPQDPYFDVQVGNENLVRITIEPNDTELDLLTKLNAVEGLVARIDADGNLRVRPGDNAADTTPNFDDQNFGGDFKLIGGPFLTNGASYADLGAGGSTRAALDNGVNIVSALFGTYSAPGGIVQNASPVADVAHQSETAVGSGVFVSFREDNLGPGADTATNIVNAGSIIEFSRKLVNEQTQELIITQESFADTDQLRLLLDTQFLNETGVNLDEELANLIVYQTAFSASARVVNAVNELFDELLRSV